MAPITTRAAGYYDVGGTWNGGAVPVAGDTITINHNVTLRDSRIIGDSPNNSSTYVVIIDSGGSLVFDVAASADITYECRGNIQIRYGGKMTIGTIAAPVPATRKFKLWFPVTLASTHYNWRAWNNGGIFEAAGSPYHMADGEHRTKLSANIGVGDTFIYLQNAVGWQTNDWIAIGVGADENDFSGTTHKPERVQVTRLTSTAFQLVSGTFAYNHRIGDHVISLERNVSIEGVDALDSLGHGGSLEVDRGAGTGEELICRLKWMKFVYCGSYNSGYAFEFNLAASNPTYLFPVGQLVIDNVLFDRGVYASGATPYGLSCKLQSNVPFSAEFEVKNACLYWTGKFYLYPLADGFQRFTLNNFTAIAGSTGANGPILGMGGNVRLLDAWISSYASTGSWGIFGCFPEITNAEIFACGTGWDQQMSDALSRVVEQKVTNLKIKNCGAYGLENMPNYQRSILYKNCQILSCATNAGYGVSYSSPLIFLNCSFQNNGVVSSGRAGAFLLSPKVRARFNNCLFGTVTRNKSNNITFDSYASYNLGRVLMEKCTFKEPNTWGYYKPVGDYYYRRSQLWSAYPYFLWDYEDRQELPNFFSFEWRDCTVLDASGADQWAADYPGVTQLLLGKVGGEERDEATVKIDGTFARKLLPFNSHEEMILNSAVPIRIPVASGQTITVKMSMRKTKDGSFELPGILLEGPGIVTEARMTAGLLNTWEQLTVTGTADAEGLCYLFVSGGTNYNNTSIGDPATPSPPPSDAMFDCVAYADGLKIFLS